jgi:hypothetical protein
VSDGIATCSCRAGLLPCAFGCAACCDDTDCLSGEACNQGTCIEACATDTDCPADRVCTGGACICADGLLDCDGVCAECCTYLDCPGSDVCENGICVPLCLDAGAACDVDADCCEGACENGECVGFSVTELPETGAGPGR